MTLLQSPDGLPGSRAPVEHTRLRFVDDDPDRLREVVRGVDAEHFMVGGSRLKVSLDRVGDTGLSLDAVSYDGGVVLRGSFSPGKAYLGMAYEVEGDSRMNGVPILAHDIQAYAEGSEFYFRPSAHMRFVAVVAPREALNEMAEELEGTSLPLGPAPLEVFSPGSASRRDLQGSVEAAVSRLDSDPRAAREIVASALVRHIVRSREMRDRGRPRDIRLATNRLRAAMDHLLGHLGSPFDGRALARATGAPLRALEYTFREALGVSPRAWHRTARLQAANRDLRLGSPALDQVSSIAERWGFRHLGRFAATYAECFGESPNETLRFRSR